MVTMEILKASIEAAGGTVSRASCWEDARHIYAFSVESIKGCYGHPKYTAHFSKESGWLTLPTEDGGFVRTKVISAVIVKT